MIEIDESTKRGHERFKSFTTFKCSDGIVRTWNEWMEWQKNRDPILENPTEAEKVRARIEKRPAAKRPAKKAVAKHDPGTKAP
jgi:hypothetical protein